MGLAVGRQRSSNGKDFGARVNNDLWQEIETKVVAGKLPTATWMKSHQTLEEVTAGTLTIEDYMGNALADALAGTAAELAQVPGLVLMEAEKQLTLAFFVCMRIAIVEQAVKKFKEDTDLDYLVKCRTEQLTKARATREAGWKLEDTGHELSGHGAKFLRCALCGNIRPLSDSGWWAANSCSGFGQVLPLEALAPVAEELETFTGRLPDFLVFKKKRKLGDDGTVKRNKKTRSEAASRLFAGKFSQLAPSSSLGDAPGPQPVWSSKLDPSHRLLFGGGAVFCTTCGAVTSRCRKGALRKKCSGKVAPGSEWRLAGLSQGRCLGWQTCPDGRGKNIKIAMKKLLVGDDALVLELVNTELSEAGEVQRIRG